MADYIDREKIFSIWRSIPAPASVTSLAAAISQTPAADVAPVRHGRWIGEPVDIDGHTAMECSECHKVRVLGEYCSSCGARMDEEEDHD